MGLLVTGSFTTAEGIPFTTLYVKLSAMTCEFSYETGEDVQVSARTLTYLSEERRRAHKTYAIPSPQIPSLYGFKTTLTDFATYPGGAVSVTYREIAAALTAKGYTVTRVFEAGQTDPISVMDVSGASQQSSESTQTTLPTPPPPSESAP